MTLKEEYAMFVLNPMVICMNKKKLKEVLDFLAPFFSYSMRKVFKKQKKDVLKAIENGLKNGIVKLDSIEINLDDVKKSKGDEWCNLLKKQLKIFYDTINQI